MRKLVQHGKFDAGEEWIKKYIAYSTRNQTDLGNQKAEGTIWEPSMRVLSKDRQKGTFQWRIE